MVILHVLASNKFAGAENVALNIFRMFKKTDSKLVYCSKEGPIRKKVENDGFNYIGLKSLNLCTLRKTIKKVKPDVVHAHDFKASFLCSLIKSDFKLISHIHNNATWLKRKCLKSRIFKFICKKADKVICVSGSIKKEFVYSDCIKDKFAILPNIFVSPEATSNVEKKYDLCFCGRLEKEKQPLKFIDICYKLVLNNPSLKAVIVGDGSLKNKVINKVEKLKLVNNIDIVGFKEKPLEFVKASKVSVNTSLYEGFGLSVLESLAMGVPVVCSNVGGLKTIVTNDVGFLCDSIEEFCESTKTLLINNEFKNKEKHCKERSKQFGNSDAYFNALRDIYDF